MVLASFVVSATLVYIYTSHTEKTSLVKWYYSSQESLYGVKELNFS